MCEPGEGWAQQEPLAMCGCTHRAVKTVKLKDGLAHLVNTKAIGLLSVRTFPATENTASKPRVF